MTMHNTPGGAYGTSNGNGQTGTSSTASSNTVKSAQANLAATAEDTKSKVAQHLGAARDELRDGAHAAREDLRELGHVAHEYADRAGAAVQRGWNDARERGRYAVERTGESVREHPLAALGIAVGVGFVLAKLLSSRR